MTVGRKATHTKVMNVMSKWPEFSYVSITMFLTNLHRREEGERVSGGDGGASGDKAPGRVKGGEGWR